jgi:hypothetical protein
VTFTGCCGRASTRVSSAARDGPDAEPGSTFAQPRFSGARTAAPAGHRMRRTAGIPRTTSRIPDRLKATSGAGVDELAVAERLVGVGTAGVRRSFYRVKLPPPEGRGFGASLTALPVPCRSDSEGLTMIRNTVPRATPSERLVPLLYRYRALWDSPEAGYPKRRGAPRCAPLAGALPHRHGMRRTPLHAQAAAARNAQNGRHAPLRPLRKCSRLWLDPAASPPDQATTMSDNNGR